MRTDDDVIVRFQKLADYFFTEAGKNRALAPGGSQKHGFGFGFLNRVVAEPFRHIVHIRQSYLDELLFGKVPQLFKLAHLLDLIIARKQYRVVVVDAEHSVKRYVVRRVRDVNIVVNAL